LARIQQQAFALNFFLVNPFFILSGFASPIAAMPKVLQWFTLINPLRYFLVVIRALSILRFRKSLD
jgi:ABC-2 type transport system permease protein